MDRKMVEEYASKREYVGLLPSYQARGMCEEPGCGDVLEYTFNTEREIITELGYEVTEDCCIPMKACAQIAAQMAVGKPVMEAYLVNADDIAAAVGGLEKESVHCAQMAELALKRTIVDYSKNKAGAS